jgi:N-formylglutamate amidohydrolase
LGGRNSIDPDKVRPDFCLASNHGTTCSQKTLNMIKERLEKKNHWVEFDKPYSGRKAGIINRYGAPGKVDAIEFEVNKKLYMKDITSPKSVQEKKIKRLNQTLGKIFHQCLKK